VDEKFFSEFSWLHTAGSGVTVTHHSEVQNGPKSTAAGALPWIPLGFLKLQQATGH